MRHPAVFKTPYKSSLCRIVVLGCIFGLLFSLTVSRSSTDFGQAALIWTPPDSYADGSPILNLASVLGGYRVYYWQDEWTEPEYIDVGSQPGVTLTQLEVGRTYNFAVSAYNIWGDESDLSEVVSTVIPKSSSSSSATPSGGGCAIAMQKRQDKFFMNNRISPKHKAPTNPHHHRHSPSALHPPRRSSWS